MLWLMILASLWGFLAVVPLATMSSVNLPTNSETWGWLAVVSLLVWFILIIIRLRKTYFFIKPSNKTHQQPLWQKILLASFVFITTLIASSSYGLYRFYQYQQSLLSQPITVIANINVQQISDNINYQIPLVNNTDKPFIIGHGFQRNVWQIHQVQPLSQENNDDEKPIISLPMQVLVTANLQRNPAWQRTLNQLAPNQQLTVKLALIPIKSPKNQPLKLPIGAKTFQLGFDEFTWLRQRNIQAKAQLIDIIDEPKRYQSSVSWSIKIEYLRWQFRQKILYSLQQSIQKKPYINTSQADEQYHAHAILLGLLTGDRALMGSQIRHSYQITGISHLLAISGPHVLMLASILSTFILFLIKIFIPTILKRLPSQWLVLWISVFASGIYALFVGFELPAQRTFYMLLIVALVYQWLIPISSYRVLAWVGLLMMWWDTTSVLQAGFWLSFVAVGLLIKFSQTFEQANISLDNSTKIYQISYFIWQSVKQLFFLQVWLFILMLPVVIWFFGKVSLLSIIINLLAVPLLGLVIVPLDMLAGLLSYLPLLGQGLSQWLWQLLANILVVFHQILQIFIDNGWAKQGYFALSSAQLILLVLFILPWWLGKGILPRLLSLPILLSVIAVNYQTKIQAEPRLITLAETKLSINLVVYANEAWLILADNDAIETNNQLKNQNYQDFTDLLDDKILPLLANYKINHLTGVISQTASISTNQLVQKLATTVPIQQYWLAGFDPLKTQQSAFQYPNISPVTCQAGKTWQSKQTNAWQVYAMTGWQLQLSLTNKERWQTQTCFVQINIKKPKIYQALIMAGDNDTILTMSETMCLVQPVDMLIVPYQLPLTESWLKSAKPTILHAITGRYGKEKLSSQNQFSIAGINANSENSTITLYQSGKQGNIDYLLQPAKK